jgi:hypothetical protein
MFCSDTVLVFVHCSCTVICLHLNVLFAHATVRWAAKFQVICKSSNWFICYWEWNECVHVGHCVYLSFAFVFVVFWSCICSSRIRQCRVLCSAKCAVSRQQSLVWSEQCDHIICVGSFHLGRATHCIWTVVGVFPDICLLLACFIFARYCIGINSFICWCWMHWVKLRHVITCDCCVVISCSISYLYCELCIVVAWNYVACSTDCFWWLENWWTQHVGTVDGWCFSCIYAV